MKKGILFILLAICSVFLLTACKGKEQEKGNDVEVFEEQIQEEEETVYTFGFSSITMENPYFIALEASLRTNIEAAGHVLITTNAGSDAQLQEQQIDELIAQKVDAIFVAPYDWIQIESAIDKIKEAGIKVINVDTQVQAFDKVDAYVGSNNTKAGYACGQDLLEKVPQGGKIILVECPNRNSINERIQGFEKAIAKKGFEVVARIDAQADLSLALSEVEAALTNNPGVVAIMCGNDSTALGALVAANSVNATDVLIYGIDGSPDVKAELAKEDSLITATVAQSTEEIGRVAADVAIKMLNGEKYDKTTYISTFIINKENVNEYGIDTWQ